MVAIKIVKIRTRYQATVWSGVNLDQERNIPMKYRYKHLMVAAAKTHDKWCQFLPFLCHTPAHWPHHDLWHGTGPHSSPGLNISFHWAQRAELQQGASIKMLLPVHQTVTSTFPHIRHERGATTDQVQQVWGWWQHSLPSCGHSDDCWGGNI